MKTETVDWPHVIDALGQLREELVRLQERIARLEGAGVPEPAAPGPVPAAQPAPKPAPVAEEIPEEIVLVLSAAIAAFLGKRARIRQIRLLGSAAWAQQGRVNIQASHHLAVQHG